MPYIITSLCTNDGACVDVCPVACIHTKPGAPQFYVDPEVCIDCEQCEIVCPVDAIFRTSIFPQSMWIDRGQRRIFPPNKAIGPVPFGHGLAMIPERSRIRAIDGARRECGGGRRSRRAHRRRAHGQSRPKERRARFQQAYTAAAFHEPTAGPQPQARQPWLHSWSSLIEAA
jgi:NAD-dependent dihydropyrimidine dehydrogenase PreA subunit